MSTVYVLYSPSLNRFYVGSCLHLSTRLKAHQDKKYHNSYTAKADDWELYYCVHNLGYQQSRKIVRHIKAMKSRRYYEHLKKYPDIIEKLKERYKA